MNENHPNKSHYAGLAGICIASFLGCIDLTVINTIIPAISVDFSTPLRDTQWVTSLFMIALAAFMVPTGTIADKYGQKKILLVGLFLFGLSSTMVGIAQNFLTLAIFRFVQGLGCAILYTVSGAIISHIFDKQHQGRALGILFSANGFGLAIGPIVGGFFSGIISWRYAFLINIPFILISIYLCVRFLPEQKEKSAKRLDTVGCLLLIAVLISLVGYFSFQLNRTSSIFMLLTIVVLGSLFLLNEINTAEPIVEFHFFKNRQFIAALASTFFLAFYYCGVLLAFPLFAADRLGINVLQTGFLLLPATVTFALMSSYIGHKVAVLKPKHVIAWGLGLFIAAGIGLALAMSVNSIWGLIIPLMLFGVGWGSILGPSTLIALRALPENQAAVAMGTSWTIHNIGGACGVAFAVGMLNQQGGSAAQYPILMYWLGGLATVVALLCLFLNKKE